VCLLVCGLGWECGWPTPSLVHWHLIVRACVCVCAHVYTCVGRMCLCMPVGAVVHAGNLNLAFLIKYIRNAPHS